MSTNNQVGVLTEDEGSPAPKLAIALIVIFMLSAVAIFIYTNSKLDRIQKVTTGQELVIGVDDATLYVPKDAITLAGVITISPLVPNVFPDTSEWYRSQVVSVEYLDGKGEPYGHVTFPKPVLICFKIAKKQWKDFTQTPNEYQVEYYDEEQDPPGWVALPMSMDADRYQLCGQTDHLSIFALAVIPNQDDPNSDAAPSPASTGIKTPTRTPTPIRLFPPASLTGSAVSSDPDTIDSPLFIFPLIDGPTRTSTPIPTNTPAPTHTPIPTRTPTPIPTSTPVPTNTPEPTDTPEPTATEPPATEAPTEPPATEAPTEPPVATDVGE